ncbi:MAG: ATP-binding protein [Patescibacteria group bacterium]
MNKLLARQLRKLFPTLSTPPTEFEKILQVVNLTYDSFDADRALAERSIELSSEELLELNQKIRDEAEKNKSILADLRLATAALKPNTASNQEWLTTKDEALDLANALTKLIKEEKQLEKQKDEFISIAAHQLRTPLGSMRWTIEAILKENNLEATLQNKIKTIYQSNLHIIDLVNSLLNVSRIDQGKVPNEPVPTNLLDVAREVAAELDGEAQKKKIAVDLQFQEHSIPQVNIDPKRFREVIENLLANAIKYSRPEGKVTVSATLVEKNIRLMVADEGIGIPKVSQNRVFTKFYRAENAARSDQTGSGLGLFLVKSYVDGWGGKVWFESVENRGTTFWVELPTNIQYTPNNQKDMPTQSPAASESKTVLIIEDDQTYQQAYLSRLPQEGYQVLQAYNGKEGLEIARKQKPNLILLDIMLPGGMNGFDVLQQLKTDRELFNIPVIMLTNLDSERETAISIGARDYIVKANTSIDQVVEKIKLYA